MVSHTPEDHPEDQFFFEEAAPLGEEMIENLQAIPDFEQGIKATPQRKDLVRRIAAAEGHLLKARYAISEFLVSGEEETLENVNFAVVADEVRKLAERTQEATEVVSSSVRAIQTETTTAVEPMQRGTQEVTQGVEFAGSAGEGLRAILSGAQKVTAMIRAIASAAEEQARSAEDVARGVTELGEAAQTASESTREASQASTQLSAKAEGLRGLVE